MVEFVPSRGESLRWIIEWKLGWSVNEKIEWRVWERQGLWKGKLWYHNKFVNLKNEGENCCYLFFYSMFLQSLYTYVATNRKEKMKKMIWFLSWKIISMIFREW